MQINRRGSSVLEAPFMILASVLVIVFCLWIGINSMEKFVKGSEEQAAAQAASDLYEAARIISLGYDKNSMRYFLSVPDCCRIKVDGELSAIFVNESDGERIITGPMAISGVRIESACGPIESGEHNLLLEYWEDGQKVIISKEGAVCSD